jgi:hypothetical protein
MATLTNPRHEDFAQALARGMSASAAYVEAGYKANPHNAAALAREKHIRTRVAELQEAAPCGFGKSKPLETLLKKPEILRDDMGRFDRHGQTLSKTAKNQLNKKSEDNALQIGAGKPGPGRPPGSLNKTTLKLKEAILSALDKVGGDEYLAKLAIENSSAFASLLGKVLPTTLTSETDGGAGVEIRFIREIVHPGGHREIEGQTLKQLPAPASHTLPSDEPQTVATSDINDLDD